MKQYPTKNEETKVEWVLRELRAVQKKYEGVRVDTFSLNKSQMAKDSADVIEDLQKENRLLRQELLIKDGMVDSLYKQMSEVQASLFSAQQELLKNSLEVPDKGFFQYRKKQEGMHPKQIVVDDPMDKNFAAHCEELRLKKEEEDAIARDLAKMDKNEQDYIEVLKIQALKEAFEQAHEQIESVKEEIDGVMGETLVPETEEQTAILETLHINGRRPEAEEHNALLEKMRDELRGDIHE